MKSNLLRRTRKTTARLERRINRLDAISRRLGWIKLVTVISGAALSYLAFQSGNAMGWIVLALSVAVYIYCARRHKRTDESRQRHELLRAIKANTAARMTLDWSAFPPPAQFSPEPGHPFRIDLDLTGDRSLHHLIDAAVTLGGSERLKSWLLETEPVPARIAARQKMVLELKPMVRFRERLALAAARAARKIHERWELEGLLSWLETHTHRARLKPVLLFLGILSGLNLTLLFLHLYFSFPGVWIVTFVVYFGLYMFRVREFRGLFEDAYYLDSMLNKFKTVMMYLERYPCRYKKELAGLCSVFQNPQDRPSRYLRRIGFLAGAAAYSQTNQVLWLLLNSLVPWDMFFSYRLDRYKEEIRERLLAWTDRFYELEALCSLASFSWLNPGYSFPQIKTTSAESDTPLFSAKNMGHPLISEETKVCNDFTLNRPGEIAIVTGSNMSGKSTFLRTVGVNLALAYAGGPVNADELRTIPFRLFTCINVSDSLSGSISYFYAEVKRLKALLSELEREHDYPVLFLIDEIFRGTNYRERMIGGRAYVKALTERFGKGIISTHDLELVKLADDVPDVHNFHFRETIEGGAMRFEYKLQPGPCPTTNALVIMRMEGLPITTEKPD